VGDNEPTGANRPPTPSRHFAKIDNLSIFSYDETDAKKSSLHMSKCAENSPTAMVTFTKKFPVVTPPGSRVPHREKGWKREGMKREKGNGDRPISSFGF